MRSNKYLINHKNQNQSMGSLSSSPSEYSLIPPEYRIHEKIPDTIIHIPSNQMYTLHIIPTFTSKDHKLLDETINTYQKSKCRSITKIQKTLKHKKDSKYNGQCAEQFNYYFILQGSFKVQRNLLSHEYQNRKNNALRSSLVHSDYSQKSGFTLQEIYSVICCLLCSTKQYHNRFGRQQWDISLDKIYIDEASNNSLTLIDPLFLQQNEKHPRNSFNWLAKYPSPEKLESLTRSRLIEFQALNNFQTVSSSVQSQFNSHLFTIGGIGLQLLTMESREDIYASNFKVSGQMISDLLYSKRLWSKQAINSHKNDIGLENKLILGIQTLLGNDPRLRKQAYDIFNPLCNRQYCLSPSFRKTSNQSLRGSTGFRLKQSILNQQTIPIIRSSNTMSINPISNSQKFSSNRVSPNPIYDNYYHSHQNDRNYKNYPSNTIKIPYQFNSYVYKPVEAKVHFQPNLYHSQNIKKSYSPAPNIKFDSKPMVLQFNYPIKTNFNDNKFHVSSYNQKEFIHKNQISFNNLSLKRQSSTNITFNQTNNPQITHSFLKQYKIPNNANQISLKRNASLDSISQNHHTMSHKQRSQSHQKNQMSKSISINFRQSQASSQVGQNFHSHSARSLIIPSSNPIPNPIPNPNQQNTKLQHFNLKNISKSFIGTQSSANKNTFLSYSPPKLAHSIVDQKQIEKAQNRFNHQHKYYENTDKKLYENNIRIDTNEQENNYQREENNENSCSKNLHVNIIESTQIPIEVKQDQISNQIMNTSPIKSDEAYHRFLEEDYIKIKPQEKINNKQQQRDKQSSANKSKMKVIKKKSSLIHELLDDESSHRSPRTDISDLRYGFDLNDQNQFLNTESGCTIQSYEGTSLISLSALQNDHKSEIMKQQKKQNEPRPQKQQIKIEQPDKGMIRLTPPHFSSTIVEQQEQYEDQGQNRNSGSPVRNMVQQYQGKQAEEEDQDEYEYVVEEYETGSRYEGFKKNNVRSGTGKFYYQDGGHYDGQWADNKMHGWGKLYYEGGKLAYQGYWKKDQFHGYGKLYNDDPKILDTPFEYHNFDFLNDFWEYYEGNLVKDTKQGRGRIRLTNGQIFQGDFHKDRIEGFGKFLSMNGQIIQGIWKDSKLFKIINTAPKSPSN